MTSTETSVTRPDPDSTSGNGRALIGTIATFLVVLLLGLLFWPSLAGAPREQQCAFSPQKQSTGPAPIKPTKLILADGQNMALPFNRGLATKTITIRYNVTGTIQDAQSFPGLRVDHLDFLRDDDVALPESRVKVAAWYQGGHVVLKVCVDRSGPKLADPGIYQSTVSIVDPRVIPIDTQVTVTLNYPDWTRVLALLVLAALAGTWYIWVLRQKHEDEAAVSAGFFRWCGSMIGVLSIAAGTIAAFTAFNFTYLNGDSWGSSSQQPIALLGAMFTAFVAGAATVHIGAAAGQAQAARKETDQQKAARLEGEAARLNQKAVQLRQPQADENPP